MEKTGNYELLYIVHPDLESSIDKILDRVRSYIEKRNGKINYEENWGKRKLAYEINKTDVGIYILWYFTAPRGKVAKIEKDIRLTEEIMRYMILAYEEKPEVSAKPKKKVEKKETKEAAKPKKKPETKASEKERLKKLDENLEKILGEDKEEKPKKKEAK